MTVVFWLALPLRLLLALAMWALVRGLGLGTITVNWRKVCRLGLNEGINT